MKTVVASILLANLNIRDLLNILLKDSVCTVTELIRISLVSSIRLRHAPPQLQSKCPIHQHTHALYHEKGREYLTKSKQVTITMEMKTPNAGGIASITLTPCALWSQSGSDSRLRHFHPIENSHHAGTEALALSQYATFYSVQFSLRSSDCICQPC